MQASPLQNFRLMYVTSGLVMAASGINRGVKPLQNAMKMAKIATQLDGGNQHKEAYCQYLRSINYITHALLEDAMEKQENEMVVVEVERMLRLAEQCLERAKTFIGRRDEPPDLSTTTSSSLLSYSVQSRTLNNFSPDDPSSIVDIVLPSDSPVDKELKSPSQSKPGDSCMSPEGSGDSSPFLPPDVFQRLQTVESQDTSRKELTPIEEASRMNQKLKANYEARLARLLPGQAYQKTSLKFDNCDELQSFIDGVEEDSKGKYITYTQDRHYNDKDWQPLPANRVYWQWAGGFGMPAIEFTGIPFMFVGTKQLVCHRGKDLALAQKKRYAEEKAKKMTDDHSFGSHRSLWQDTKKVGCPAAISISKIATFPKFKVVENRQWSKKTTSKMLRKALESDPVVWETCYAVTHLSVHAGHATGEMEASIHEPVDLRKTCVNLTKQIVDKIYIVEDQDNLKELSQKLTTMLKDITPQTRNEDGMPLHLQAKRVRVSADIPVTTPLPQRSIGRPKSTYTGRVGAHAESIQRAHKVPGVRL